MLKPDTKLRKALGARAKQIRLSKSLSPSDVAERMNLDESAVRAIEAGRRGLSLETLIALATTLGCEPGELLGDKGSPAVPLGEIARQADGLSAEWQTLVLEIIRGIRLRAGQERGRNPAKVPR
jgi:transcriptional regulator with XRE-family HTH domain